MATKLYVGNLAFQTTSEELQELFAQAGTVQSASVVEDRDTGRSRGFGFVEMSSNEEAAAAIDQFNGKEVNGRALKVNEANRAKIVAVADVAFPAGAVALAVIVAAIVVVTTAVIASHAGSYQKAAVSGKQTVFGPVVDSFATGTAAVR